MDTAIKIENLSKRYQLFSDLTFGQISFRDALSRKFKKLSRGDFYSAKTSDFWALKNINLEIKKGDRVGLIGRNGAGKSTLLKVLSRITPPTEGRVSIHGKVVSLLEVGTGFHPDLTGRENIYLSGAVLGMSKNEIKRKLDQIVEFSEVSRFIDDPVKRYSSGMYMRLAFSVAAHLDHEILIVDEVLAVGDARFQKKCIDKMNTSQEDGKTILFVSHNMNSIEKLCTRGIVLKGGEVICDSNIKTAIGLYLERNDLALDLEKRTERLGNGIIRFTGAKITSEEGEVLEQVRSGQTCRIALNYKTNGNCDFGNLVVSLGVKTPQDQPIFLITTRTTGQPFSNFHPTGTFTCTLPELALVPGTYRANISIIDFNGEQVTWIDQLEDALEFEVIEGDFYGSGELPPSSHGHSLVKGSWKNESR